MPLESHSGSPAVAFEFSKSFIECGKLVFCTSFPVTLPPLRPWNYILELPAIFRISVVLTWQLSSLHPVNAGVPRDPFLHLVCYFWTLTIYASTVSKVRRRQYSSCKVSASKAYFESWIKQQSQGNVYQFVERFWNSLDLRRKNLLQLNISSTQ